MSTFDDILPKLTDLIESRHDEWLGLLPILLNRDLNGRVRFVLDAAKEDDDAARTAARKLATEALAILGPHAYDTDDAILFEPDLADLIAAEPAFPVDDLNEVYLVDRLAVEADWSSFLPQTDKAPRIVFFSIKGGVGRSTALAVTAWHLAERGHRVMVIDLDLESPGLSSSLLPDDRMPTFGVTDWLVEDLVGNADVPFESMVASSGLSRNGDIYVVPAHGKDPGEYVAKLGRVWMPKVQLDGQRESWSQRLVRLLEGLEARWAPDVVLLDSRAGIDEASSACVTDIGATTVLLFALDGDQTWDGYSILFQHWLRTRSVGAIRERLQMVGALIPDDRPAEYFSGLRERAWDAFVQSLYDAVPPGEIATGSDWWSFDEADESAPHHPWGVRWHRGFAALESVRGRLETLDDEQVHAVFGPLIEGIERTVDIDGGAT